MFEIHTESECKLLEKEHRNLRLRFQALSAPRKGIHHRKLKIEATQGIEPWYRALQALA